MYSCVRLGIPFGSTTRVRVQCRKIGPVPSADRLESSVRVDRIATQYQRTYIAIGFRIPSQGTTRVSIQCCNICSILPANGTESSANVDRRSIHYKRVN